MRHEFRSHDVARLTAKLRCFHVLDRTIGQLRTYDHVENGCDGQEPRQAPQRRLPIKNTFTACRSSTFSKINAERNECQSGLRVSLSMSASLRRMKIREPNTRAAPVRLDSYIHPPTAIICGRAQS